ncbi:MAG: signal peptidase II [Patescibacteria group bacterium]
MQTSSKKLIFSFLIIIPIIILDQTSKLIVLASKVPTFCNTGFAFGIYQGVLNGLVAFLVLVALILAFYREQKRTVYYSLALIMGGGASNILDRLTRGCVIDFIDLKIWPSFNLADAAITIGTAILILSIALEMKAYQKH